MENENIAAVYMDIESLVPWGDNPRDNDQEQKPPIENQIQPV